MGWSKKLAVGIAAVALSSSTAGAFGGLTGPDGSVIIDQSRAAVIRTADRVEFVVQIRYQGTPSKLVWLLAFPNFIDPVDAGVRAGVRPSAALAELAEATAVELVGACDGDLTGERSVEAQLAYGPAQAAALPRRFFTALELEAGNLPTYLDSVGVAYPPALQEAVEVLVDQNFMLVAFLIDPADLGVDKVDPVASLSFPVGAGQSPRLSLRLNAANHPPAQPMDFVFFALGSDRSRFSLPALEMPLGDVTFTGPESTDYLGVVDALVGTRQTRAFVTEWAGRGDTIARPAAAALIGEVGAGYVTRLRGRMAVSGLASPGVEIISLDLTAGPDVGGEHQVKGASCDGPNRRDAGGTPIGDAEPRPPEDIGGGGIPPGDASLPRADAAVDGDARDGGVDGEVDCRPRPRPQPGAVTTAQSNAAADDGTGDYCGGGGCLAGPGRAPGGAPLTALSVLLGALLFSRRRRR